MIYTGLVQFGDDLNVKGQLAQSWDQSSNGLTWTFHLKPNLKFSDGTPLTSKDVAYSIDRALQPTLKSVTAPIYLALIKDSDKLAAGKISTIIGDSVSTPDDSTVVLVANKKAAYFLDALTYSCSYVVEKSLIDKYGNQKFTDHLTEGGGAGPFKVAEYNHSQQIVFVPNSNFYGPAPQLQKVIMPFYKEVASAYQAYQVGQVSSTGTYSFPTTYLPQARQHPAEFHLVPQLNINYYAMNYLVKPFDNIHMRQAFELAVNKDAIVHAVWKDLLIPTNHIVPQGMPGYNPTLTGPDGTENTSGNPTKAKALFQQGLREEGWTSLAQMPAIRLTYPTGQEEYANEVTTVTQMWQSVLGVSVQPDPIDFNRELSEIVTNKLQFWVIAWIADYPDPQDWLTLQFDKGVPNNNMNYGQNNSADAAQQQAVQQQLEAADVNINQAARLQAYNQAEQQLGNDVAWMPMEQAREAILLKPCVKGIVFNASGLTPPDDWGNTYISTDTPCSNAT
jgi:peptide/nickel transport system substrate-binding protein/oligopeptide transport system substrate-binding protein